MPFEGLYNFAGPGLVVSAVNTVIYGHVPPISLEHVILCLSLHTLNLDGFSGDFKQIKVV